ncbi:MAG: hypothetical protein K1X31_13235 [Gemmatimonadaceae bacterium]|nr:hypothetical protein [Gemmatimonadaceae bacterium]
MAGRASAVRLAALVATLAASLAPAIGAPLAAQGGVLRRPPARMPRLDGLRVGVAGARQDLGILSATTSAGTSGDGLQTSASWGLHPRLAVVASRLASAAPYPGGDFRLTQVDALFHYQLSRGWRAYPYLEAGLTHRTLRLESGPAVTEQVGWAPTLGAGLRLGVADRFAVLGGVRHTRGLLDDFRVDGSAADAPVVRTASTRLFVGAEWRPAGIGTASGFVVMRRPRLGGLGLALASTYAEGVDGAERRQGSGTTFGVSWGIGAHLAIAVRESRDRVFALSADEALHHRDYLGRWALAGLVTGVRPYLEGGVSAVQRRSRPSGLLTETRGTMPLLGAGLLYGVQPDLDVDVGLVFTSGRLEPGGADHRSFRLRAGLEYRPAR